MITQKYYTYNEISAEEKKLYGVALNAADMPYTLYERIVTLEGKFTLVEYVGLSDREIRNMKI